jgi:uncharacterized membrane protein YcaP (DUF421 family)
MEILYDLIGKNQSSIEWWQMAIRAFIVFVLTLAMVRMGATRIFGRNSAFDIVLGIVLGSVLSRAITANSPFFPTIIAAIVLILLHILFARISMASHKFGWIVKGKQNPLVINGEIQPDQMKKCKITENDLLESLRIKGKDDLQTVRDAFLERSGEISIIFKEADKYK